MALCQSPDLAPHSRDRVQAMAKTSPMTMHPLTLMMAQSGFTTELGSHLGSVVRAMYSTVGALLPCKHWQDDYGASPFIQATLFYLAYTCEHSLSHFEPF